MHRRRDPLDRPPHKSTVCPTATRRITPWPSACVFGDPRQTPPTARCPATSPRSFRRVEPLAADDDPAAAFELPDSVSMAMLVVLETLSPLERATFVLREVFDLPYDEIADTLGRSEAAVRQLAHRAREHVHARQPRHRVDK